MTTVGSSAPGSGQVRGRGLDALFDGSPAPSPSDTEIDPELAAMLDQEVRAGAPPIESVLPITEPTREGDQATPATTRAVAMPVGMPSLADSAASPPSGDGAIDLPSPVVDPSPAVPTDVVTPPPITPSPVMPPPVTPQPLPVTPPPVTPQPAPVSPTLAPGANVRIGAVIIDTTPTGASTTAGDAQASDVGPAGELITTGQAGLQVIPAELVWERDVLPPGPGVRPTPLPMPAPQQLTDDQKTIVINRLDNILEPGWQKTFHKQINDLYKQVAMEFSSPPANADRMLTLLQEAQQILIETPQNYVAAEYRVVQVQAMISRTSQSRKQSVRYGPRILIYQVLWLALFLVGLIFAAPLADFVTRSGNIAGAVAGDVFPFWSTLMWGGIGGIIGALYALWWHVSDQQDFERQYLLWYLVQPIMGMVLGGIVFLLLTGGFLLLQIKPSDPNAGARLLPYLVAVLAGFRQNFIYGQFDRLIALFAPSGNQGNGQNQG